MKYLLKHHNYRSSEGGQIIILFALLVSFIMVLACWVINTGQLVAHKIHLQNVADMAAYSGASVMAYHMSNIDGNGIYDDFWTEESQYVQSYEDSIAELNRRIMVEYMILRNHLTLMNCTSGTGPETNCKYGPVHQTGCDASGNNHKSWVEQHRNTAQDLYLNHVTQLRSMIRELSENAFRKSRKIAKDTVTKNLKGISQDEINIFSTPLQFEEEIASLHFSYWTMIVPTASDVICILSSGGGQIVDKYLVLPRRLFLNTNHGNGYTLVGLVEKPNLNDTTNTNARKPIDYVNWSSTFGEHNSPIFQAWSAAKPWRETANISETDYWIRAIRDVHDAMRQSHPNSGDNYLAKKEHIWDIDNPKICTVVGDTAVCQEAGASTADPLFKVIDLPFTVRFIPLNQELYGSSNPFTLFGLSRALFANDDKVKKLASGSGKNMDEIFRYILWH